MAEVFEDERRFSVPPLPRGTARLDLQSSSASSGPPPGPTRTIGLGDLAQEARRQGRLLWFPERPNDLVEWIREWMSTPDDKGDEWWADFERELFERRPVFRTYDS